MRPILVVALVSILVNSLIALPAQAQLVQREKPADAKKDGKGKDTKGVVDDDILAPEKTDKDRKTEAPVEAKPKAFTVGLVGIVPLGDTGKPLADEVTKALLKELGAGTTFDVTALAVQSPGAAGGGAGVDEAAAKQALADGTAAFEKGRGFVDKMSFGKARKAFELALENLEKAAPVLADPQPIFDARVGLAEVAARQGQENEAEIQLAYAAVINPELDLDKAKFPPQFVRTHQKIREKAMKEARGVVVVDASGGGAAVQIDGRPTDNSPVKITEVPPGRHVVRALREGLPAYGTVVDVKSGGEVVVSPGFVAADGKSWIDDLQNNRFSAESAKVVADAAKAANLKAAVVGVASKTATSVPVQMVYVDAASGSFAKLPAVAFEQSLLDVGIEVLKAREGIELQAEKLVPEPAALATLIEGAKAGASVETALVALRYDVKAAPRDRPSSRLVGGDTKPSDGDDELRSVLSAGKTGTRQRLDDGEDVFDDPSKRAPPPPDPEAPITEQPWFWPTVLGGGAGALVVIGAGTYLGLVAGGMLPDPRPAGGAQINLALP